MYAENLQARKEAEANLATLTDQKTGFVTGASPDQAKVAVIELFDYHCGACKSASQYVRSLASDDPDVLVSFREFPILRRESESAAEYALAAKNQEKYLELHFAMMNARGLLTDDRIAQLAKAQKINVQTLQADADDQQVFMSIMETMQIAQKMGVSSTPSFIIATLDGQYVDVMRGFHPQQLQSSIEAAKASTESSTE